MDSVKDWFQIVAWSVASIGGVIAAFRAIVEMRRNREQLKQELRWRQARESKEILDTLNEDARSRSAMTMLDWNGREYEIKENVKERISKSDVVEALRTTNLTFDRKEAFIRDCFDHFFDGLERINHFITIDLINFSDVEAPLRYYVALFAKQKSAYQGFMTEYDFAGALQFCERYPEWRDA